MADMQGGSGILRIALRLEKVELVARKKPRNKQVVVKRNCCQVKTLDSNSSSFYNTFMIEKMIRVGRLYDRYGALLTEHQRKCLELHYLQDLSLGEIAAELGVSRQAINDILRRAEESLEQYEEKLNLLVQEKKRTENLLTIQLALLEALKAKHPAEKELQRALDAVEILKQEMGY